MSYFNLDFSKEEALLPIISAFDEDYGGNAFTLKNEILLGTHKSVTYFSNFT